MIRTPNKSQQEAIRSTEGPLLIIAGPGMTFRLVERIVHMVLRDVRNGKFRA